MEKAVANSVHMEAGMTSPFRNAHCLAVEGQHASTPCIATLLLLSSPFAVIGRVALAVVDAVNGVIWRRPLSHVVEEILKVIPPLTDRNASPAIMFVACCRGTVAAHSHVQPVIIFGRSAYARRLAMRHASQFFPASTRASIAPRYIVNQQRHNFAAYAQAHPFQALAMHTTSALYGSMTKYCEEANC